MTNKYVITIIEVLVINSCINQMLLSKLHYPRYKHKVLFNRILNFQELNLLEVVLIPIYSNRVFRLKTLIFQKNKIMFKDQHLVKSWKQGHSELIVLWSYSLIILLLKF